MTTRGHGSPRSWAACARSETEVSVNGGRDSYRAVAAQARADAERARPKVAALIADSVLTAHVGALLWRMIPR